MDKMIPGFVHLYTGDGKGKTTAAIGLAVRARGTGKRVFIAQFLKGRQSGELEPLRQLGIDVVRTEEMKKFVFQMNDAERAQAKAACDACWAQAKTALLEHTHDLVVLDEAVDAVNLGLLDEDDMLAAVEKRAPSVEVVLTGRNPGDKIVNAADYYTMMCAAKHPYRRGVAARSGIEF
jgi:cob(I)alamin adenosyltransferase